LKLIQDLKNKGETGSTETVQLDASTGIQDETGVVACSVLFIGGVALMVRKRMAGKKDDANGDSYLIQH